VLQEKLHEELNRARPTAAALRVDRSSVPAKSSAHDPEKFAAVF
jgi:hypothetical protein